MDKSKEFFHYRNAFKSDHLASADIEELQENNNGIAILRIIKIEYFEKRKVAGRTKDKGLVAFFADKNDKKIKPMIVNSINSKIIASFIGSANVNEWGKLNLLIELYVDPNVKMKGQVVGGIRIKKVQPKGENPKPDLLDSDIEKSVSWMKDNPNNTIEVLKKLKNVSAEQESEINNLLNSSK